MLKLFKKQEQSVEIINSTKTYPKEVLEIHREFEIASEKLLEQANNIINSQPSVNKSKIEALKKLGFKQVKEVQESTEILAKTEVSKEQIELVQYYKQTYPYNKFITEEQIKTICHKYNLVCGDVDRFKGFVPEKNLNEIVNFKVKTKDVLKKIKSVGTYGDNIGRIIDDNGVIAERWSNIFKKIEEDMPLQICAPIKDMDFSGLELRDSYKLVEKHIPDPVVLQPVKGGYLILTAWGDEASDPLIVNNNHN